MTQLPLAPGIDYYPGRLGPDEQAALLAELRRAMSEAPPFRPRMPRTGKPFSVRMINLGLLGWVSDEAGYRYAPLHPETAQPWPPIPPVLLDLWFDVAGYPAPPEACLVNLYDANARMGLHQDRDEQALDAPVVSVSLGDTAVFRVGGLARSDPTRSVRLASGDVVVIGGAGRLAFHGIDRVIPGTSRLLPEGGRVNCTLRRVTRPGG